MLDKFNHHKGIILILIASLFWGTTGTVASFAPEISPLAIGAFAMGVGGVFLVLNSLKELSLDWRLLRGSAKVFVFGGLSVALYPLAFYTSMRLSGVAIGTVISLASAPFFAALIERLISNKLVSLKWMLSFAIGILGIVLLTLGKVQEPLANNTAIEQYAGILLGLVAGLTYAIYSWSARNMINRGVNAKSAMAGMFGFAAILLLPSLAFTGGHLFSSANNAFVAIYMALVPMFLGYLMFGYGLKQVEASTATLLTMLEPIVATILAVVVLGEGFMFVGWIGMGLILVCLLLQTLKLPKFRFNQLRGIPIPIKK
ncbi:DMT family transporter [Paraglaciecola arctica]|uniref:Drug/metabolite transporter, DME family n=1 Tax=Paraglaciecola arctica BSs20135 TaxID=493475 RepID=K6Y0M2_9ALTE|nr:EamA family transporter [Paraglaciecola arctica]GAC17461.1 drug/metabolite transporter, DME family [Paraglaciecola arctica BSs20135]